MRGEEPPRPFDRREAGVDEPTRPPGTGRRASGSTTTQPQSGSATTFGRSSHFPHFLDRRRCVDRLRRWAGSRRRGLRLRLLVFREVVKVESVMRLRLVRKHLVLVVELVLGGVTVVERALRVRSVRKHARTFRVRLVRKHLVSVVELVLGGVTVIGSVRLVAAQGDDALDDGSGPSAESHPDRVDNQPEQIRTYFLADCEEQVCAFYSNRGEISRRPNSRLLSARNH